MSRVPCAGSVLIDNATGKNTLKVNGVFEPTLELCGNLPVYQKKGNSDVWLEYYKLNWWVRKTSDRGTTIAFANITTERPCLPQDCDVGAWSVGTGGNGMVPGPLVTVTLLSAPSSEMEAITEQVQQVFDTEVLTV